MKEGEGKGNKTPGSYFVQCKQNKWWFEWVYVCALSANRSGI